MIRVYEIKMASENVLRHVPFEEQLIPFVAKKLRVDDSEIDSVIVKRHAIDARKKPRLFDVFTVDASFRKGDAFEAALLKKCKDKDVTTAADVSYVFPGAGDQDEARGDSFGAKDGLRPVIAGFGPAGIFCAYELALHGYRPIVLERGADTDERVKDVTDFWKGEPLKTESNVQFGEGGAGAFSDGKLNSGIKDKSGRIQEVLRVLVEHGAPKEILYEAMPHIGTDLLRDVVKRIREHIIALGGEVRFHTKLTGIEVSNGRVCAVSVSQGDGYTDSLRATSQCTRPPDSHYRIETDTVVLAIGHSARDTFVMLRDAGIAMEQKAFAVGLRVLHPQAVIDEAQYGVKKMLPPASYKLTHQTASGRGVYSFCMCPGGYVVNASSEEGMLCVNGMSDHARDSGSANSAIVVQVRPEDYAAYGSCTQGAAAADGSDAPEGDDVLAGMYFQQELEKRAYEIGQGAVPVETWGEFSGAVACAGDTSSVSFADSCLRSAPVGAEPRSPGPCAPSRGSLDLIGSIKDLPLEGKVAPQATDEVSHDRLTIPYIKGRYRFAPVHNILPAEFNQCIIEGMNAFGKKIDGFDAPDTLLAGVESRTSSPVRIVRDDTMQSLSVKGLYPAGEGAGYAGGIMSAAVDGIKVAERINHGYDTTTDR